MSAYLSCAYPKQSDNTIQVKYETTKRVLSEFRNTFDYLRILIKGEKIKSMQNNLQTQRKENMEKQEKGYWENFYLNLSYAPQFEIKGFALDKNKKFANAEIRKSGEIMAIDSSKYEETIIKMDYFVQDKFDVTELWADPLNQCKKKSKMRVEITNKYTTNKKSHKKMQDTSVPSNKNAENFFFFSKKSQKMQKMETINKRQTMNNGNIQENIKWLILEV